jgi:hypothetical protein
MATTEPVATTSSDSAGSIESNVWVQWITVAATLAGLIVSLYAIREAMKGKG